MRQCLLGKQALIFVPVVVILILTSSTPLICASREFTENIQQGRPLTQDQQPRSLTQDQIEQLIRNSTPDSAITIEIQRRGIDFQPDPEVIDHLRRLGAGPKTLHALNVRLKNSFETRPRCPSSSDRIVILVANFQSLDEKRSDAVTELILDQLREATREFSDLEIVALNEWISPQQGRDNALARGKTKNANIVLWGWYKRSGDKVLLTVHFDPVRSIPRINFSSHQQTRIVALPEIESFTIQMRLSKEMAYLTLLTIGLARLEVDDYEGTINRLTKAVQHGVAPDQIVRPSSLYLARGLAYFLKAVMGSDKSSALENAIIDSSKAAELDPELPGPYLLLGFALLYNSELEKALEAAERVIKLKPDKSQEATAFLLMVLVNRLKGSNEKAQLYATRSIKILETLPESEETLYLLSQVYFNSDDVIRATISLDRAAKLAKCDSSKVMYSLNRALIYGSSRNFDKAVAELDYVIRMRPGFAYAYWVRGGVYAEQKSYDLAIEDYGRAIALNLSIPDVYDDRGDAHDAKGESDKALADYKEAVKVDPHFSPAFYKLGLAYRLREQYDAAIASFSSYLKLEPKDVDAYRNRAWLYEDKGQYDLAIADVDEMIKLEPKDHDRYSWRARLNRASGRLDRAIEDYGRFIAANPNDASGYIRRGSVYRASKQLDKAFSDFNTGIAMNPTDPSGYDGRAMAYSDAGKYEQAIADLKMVIQLTTDPLRRRIAENVLESIRLEQEIKSLKIKTKQSDPR